MSIASADTTQEVDNFDDLMQYIQKRGLDYDGVYAGRSDGKKDGCAVLWRKSILQCLRVSRMDLDAWASESMAGDFCPDHSPVQGLRESEISIGNPAFFERHNVALLLALQSLEGLESPPLLVCCTHLYWDPAADVVKQAQARLILSRLQTASTTWGTKAIVLAGDFNSLPGSIVHSLLQEESSWGYPSYRARLQSAYALAHGEEPEFTNYTASFVGTLDYVFFLDADGGLRLDSVAKVPVRERVLPALPNKTFPSDHVPIKAYFQWAPSSQPATR